MKLALSWLGWDIFSVELMRRQTHDVYVDLVEDEVVTVPDVWDYNI